MQKFFVVLMLVLFGSSMAIAAGGQVMDIGSWSDPTTGEIFKFVNAKSNDSVRLNQSVIYVMHTSVQKDVQTGKWMPKTDMARVDAASNNGIWNGFMQGGMAGIAQGAGVATGMALLRPSPTNINAGNGNNANLANSQQQGQIQFQKQTLRSKVNNTNLNTANGGEGGKGGSVVNSGNNVGVSSIDAGSGGIGNTTNTAKGNAVIQTGDGNLTTGANSPITD
jgi:hypothetical protein